MDSSPTSSCLQTKLQARSIVVKVGLFLNIIAFILGAIALIAPYWLVNDQLDSIIGPLFGCTANDCKSSDPEPWQTQLAAVESVGMILATSCLVFTLLFVFLPATSGQKWVKLVIIILASLAAIFILSGTVIAGTNTEGFPELFPGFRPVFDLSWAFALALVAGLLYVTIALCFCIDAFV